MKKILLLVSIAAVCFFVPMQISSAYIQSEIYEVITVKTGDTVWSIASRYVSDKEDIRHKIAEIQKINELGKNAQIYPGQQLRIPCNN